ncbi:MAG: ECF transporter S component [Lachnospiraceae bacterium]|nr:ECF transporter S component [Lachnospiraceae bacterium]
MKTQSKIYKMVLSAMFLALAMVLPFLTGQIPQIGKALSPMHIPVFLAGFFVGPVYAALIGFVAPLLRAVLFGMPALFPNATAMAFELATYGAVSGLLYKALPNKKINIYLSLIGAMLAGRIVWGAVMFFLMGIGKAEFGIEKFLAVGFINAVPGIILHIVLVPILVMALRRYTIKNNQ